MKRESATCARHWSPARGLRKQAATLAAQRLGPLRPYIDGIRRLVVLPSAGMASVPLEVLVEAWADAPKDLTVSYAPSATMFERLTRARSSASALPRLLALGDPTYPLDEVQPPPTQAPRPVLTVAERRPWRAQPAYAG